MVFSKMLEFYSLRQGAPYSTWKNVVSLMFLVMKAQTEKAALRRCVDVRHYEVK